MEAKLELVMDEITSKENVAGCIFADHLGLCLGTKNVADTSAGLIVAVADLACRLEPNSRPPVVLLESDTRACLIQKSSSVTGAIFKATQST